MKYLAILKDSFRETIDFKLFYVLLILSIVLSVACASFVFPRLPAEEALNNNIVHLRAEKVEVLRELPFYSTGRYRVTFKPTQTDKGFAGRLESAVELAANIRAVVRQALTKGDAKVALDPPDFTKPKKDPQTPMEWQALLGNYLTAMPGVREGTVEPLNTVGAQTPETITAEMVINWAEMPKAHKFGVAFGIWEFDLGDVPMTYIVFGIQIALVDLIAGWAGIIIAVIVTAGFVPNMLHKGTIDLLLAKPISRPLLLIYKYLGGLCFIFFNATVLVGGSWIAFGLTTGNWSPWYLASILVLLFFFAILYSFSVFLGVTTRSQLAVILITIGLWFALFLINRAFVFTNPTDAIAKEYPWTTRVPSAISKTTEVVHAILPKPSDLSILNQSLLWRGRSFGDEELLLQQQQLMEKFSWRDTLLTSGIYITLFLGLACWRFSRQDY